MNNEGFAIAPESECVDGSKYVFWADDGETDGHSIRRATPDERATDCAACDDTPIVLARGPAPR